MQIARLVLVAALAFGPSARAETTPVPAAVEQSFGDLSAAMQFDALFDILRADGIAHGQTREADMFPAGGGAAWTTAVSEIYDTVRLRAGFDAALEKALADDPALLAEIVTFFQSELGRKVVGLEIDARRAFLDKATEEAARVAADRRAAARDPKLALIRRFIEAGDLLEMNVAGGLSGNLAFMQGMRASGAYGPGFPDDQILSDVWAQEAQIRDDTASWLNAYLGLAYDPLSEDELEGYVAFSESPAGKRLNAALFTAFDAIFRQVSYDLGRAAGEAAQGSDI
jgi:hypothetical protein